MRSKIIAVLLFIILVMVLSACSSNTSDIAEETTATKTKTAVTVETTEEADVRHTSESDRLAAEEGTQIKITAGETVLTATLNNTKTSSDFIKSLPVTIKMTRWGNREYYGKVENALSEEGELQNGFENGDVAYWPSGKSFAIFFNKEANLNISNLIKMGTITSDLKLFNNLDESVEMKIEVSN